MIAVTPGIRPAWTLVEKDDQKRIVTPADAVRNGSDYVVIGRPIRDAKDPRMRQEGWRRRLHQPFETSLSR